MSQYHAIRSLKKNNIFGKGDVLVLFGELFSKGYANGLVEEAERRGMKILRSTVGRRDAEGHLQPLDAELAAQVPQPFINIPLEAGFDLEEDKNGVSLVGQLKDVKLSNWENAKIDFASLEECKQKGRKRFRTNVEKWLTEVKKHIPAGSNVLFAHLMAGGVPRAKIVLPLVNRAVKGTGDRFLSSEKLWTSEIGRACSESFDEVTAETFHTLLDVTTAFRDQQKAAGKQVSYVAYGYHGTEILIGGNYTWQTYSPYIQGWAKKKLEGYSKLWADRGATCTVYNCPEILTNSSSIFSGVEVSLYPLLGALQKENSSERAKKVIADCLALLRPDVTVDSLMKFTQTYLMSPEIRAHCEFEKWPQHNSQAQLEKMLATSDELISMHKDPKHLITLLLSEVVFHGCGMVMLDDAAKPEASTAWINHDIIAKIW